MSSCDLALITFNACSSPDVHLKIKHGHIWFSNPELWHRVCRWASLRLQSESLSGSPSLQVFPSSSSWTPVGQAHWKYGLVGESRQRWEQPPFFEEHGVATAANRHRGVTAVSDRKQQQQQQNEKICETDPGSINQNTIHKPKRWFESKSVSIRPILSRP